MARPPIVKAVADIVKPPSISPVEAVKMLYMTDDSQKNRSQARAAAASIDNAIAAERKRQAAQG